MLSLDRRVRRITDVRLQKSLNKCLTCLAADDKSPQREYSTFQTSSLGLVSRLGKKFIIRLSVCGVFYVNNNSSVHFVHLTLVSSWEQNAPSLKWRSPSWFDSMVEGRADLGGGGLQPSTFQLKVSGENQTTTSAAGREGKEKRGSK